MDQPFNEHSSLQLIESMINKAKNNFSESGTLYLVWGITVFICSMVQFIAGYFFNNYDAGYIWMATWLVVIYQLFYLSKKTKRERVKTYTGEILKYVWICFVCCMFVLVFILVFQEAYTSIDPAILVLYGVPTFLSGAILKFRPLMIGGLICWVLAAGSAFADTVFQMLFISAAVLAAWIIPGYLLRRKFKNQL